MRVVRMLLKCEVEVLSVNGLIEVHPVHTLSHGGEADWGATSPGNGRTAAGGSIGGISVTSYPEGWSTGAVYSHSAAHEPQVLAARHRTTLGAPFNLSNLWSSWFIPSERKTFSFTHRPFISRKQSKITLGICTEKQRFSDWLKILPYTACKTHTCRISDETKAVAEVFCFPYSMLSSKDLPWTTLSHLGKGKTIPIWRLQSPYLPYLWCGSWLSRRPESLGAYYYLLTAICLPV